MNSANFKYIDNLTLAEAIPLKNSLENDNEIVLTASFHQRTGHKITLDKCSTQDKINETVEFANKN